MTDTPSIPSDGGTLEALIEKWRRDAAACDAFLTGEIPCPVWVVSNDPALVRVRAEVLREVIAALEQVRPTRPVDGETAICPTHGPITGLTYCPECASNGEPWTEREAAWAREIAALRLQEPTPRP